jgi:hypothetical protein
MNALLIYPEFPETFWSFKHALKFLGKRAAHYFVNRLRLPRCYPAPGKNGW